VAFVQYFRELHEMVAYGRYLHEMMAQGLLREIAIKIQIYHQMLAFKIKCQLLIKMEVLLRENYILHKEVDKV
jgi:hypothetical protein